MHIPSFCRDDPDEQEGHLRAELKTDEPHQPPRSAPSRELRITQGVRNQRAVPQEPRELVQEHKRSEHMTEYESSEPMQELERLPQEAQQQCQLMQQTPERVFEVYGRFGEGPFSDKQPDRLYNACWKYWQAGVCHNWRHCPRCHDTININLQQNLKDKHAKLHAEWVLRGQHTKPTWRSKRVIT
jgi:hypothetical protein